MVNFEYYLFNYLKSTETIDGSIPQSLFAFYVNKAERKLNHYTHDRLKTAHITDNIKDCLCEMAEFLYKNDASVSNIASETTDGHSVAYKNVSKSDFEKELYNIAMEYLGFSSLMYMGHVGC